ncbi:MAG: M23 family metallopeptidase [Rubrivivax sp.]
MGAAPQSPVTSSAAKAPMSAFAVEQFGALSARLFKLESQAGQLGEHIRAMAGQAPKSRAAATPTPAKSSASAVTASRGGPMLPPLRAAPGDLGSLKQRLLDIERQITHVADAARHQHLALLHVPSRLPLDGAEMTSTFGNREDPFTGRRAFHAGVDFAASAGAAIRAAAAGTVSFAGFHPAYGWMVEIEHGNQLTTRYAHASSLKVTRGQLVRAGDTVASVGSSGRSTGPHLHFEVLRQGQPIDPRLYLSAL